MYIQIVLAGVLRGCGKQLLVAISNIGSFYLVGLPVSLTLVYVADMGALGFWVGCTFGSITQVKVYQQYYLIGHVVPLQLTVLAILIIRTDFNVESHKVQLCMQSSCIVLYTVNICCIATK